MPAEASGSIVRWTVDFVKGGADMVGIADGVWRLARMAGEGEAMAEQNLAAAYTGQIATTEISDDSKALVEGAVGAARYAGQIGQLIGQGETIAEQSSAVELTGDLRLAPTDEFLKGVAQGSRRRSRHRGH